MPKGRPSKPLEHIKATARDSTHKADGRPLVKVEMNIDRSVPALPEAISGRGAQEWERIWGAGWWLARDQDYHWVEMISRAYSDIERFRAQVEEEGLVVTGYAGQPTAHPLIGEISKLQQTIMKCLQVLGFSPTDRAKLMIETQKAGNALQEMIAASRAQP